MRAGQVYLLMRKELDMVAQWVRALSGFLWVRKPNQPEQIKAMTYEQKIASLICLDMARIWQELVHSVPG